MKLRSVAAVVAGYLLFAVMTVALFALSGRDAHAPQGTLFTVLSTVYGMVFAGVGGYLAGRLAQRMPVLHAGIVAVFIALGAVASIPSVPDGVIPWSQVAALVLMAPSALVGGMAARRLAPPA